MKANKRKRTMKKHFARTTGILLAAMIVVSTGSSHWVMASVLPDEKEQAVIVDDRAEKEIVWLDGKNGDDENNGDDKEKAVKTFAKAKELAGEKGNIKICGTVTVEKDEIWNVPDGVEVTASEDSEDALVHVEGSLVLENVRISRKNITGEGKVTGASESDRLYIPMSYHRKEAQELSKIHLSHCQGEGIFFWKNEKLIPDSHKFQADVVFQPKDTQKTDYTKEPGWDEETQTIVRTVTVVTDSLKNEEPAGQPSVTPEVTPSVTPEVTPSVTPEAAPSVTPEVTPSVTPEVTPSVTPEVTPSVTPEVTPSVTPEVTPSVTPEITPSVTPEAAPSVTPEAVPSVTPEAAPSVTPEAAPSVIPEEEKKNEEQKLVEEVQNLIDYLPRDIESDEVVRAVVDATKQYEALEDHMKQQLASGTYEKLQSAQEKTAVYNHTSNHVSVKGDLPWYVQLHVALNNDKNDQLVLEEYNVDTFIAPYDLSLWDLMNEKEYFLDGRQVEITLPAPEEGMYTKLTVIHYLDDGNVVYITPVLNGDGTMTFVTDSFSPYNIAGSKIAGSNPLVGHTDKAYDSVASDHKEQKPQTPQTPAVNNNSSSDKKTETRPQVRPQAPSDKSTVSNTNAGIPLTGDDQPVVIYMIIAAAALLLVVIIAVVMRKKK